MMIHVGWPQAIILGIGAFTLATHPDKALASIWIGIDLVLLYWGGFFAGHG